MVNVQTVTLQYAMYASVDGRNPATQLRLVVYANIYLYKSQVIQDLFHQQYHSNRNWFAGFPPSTQ